METLQNSLSGYCYSIENFYPNDGESHLINSTRRYLGERLSQLTATEKAQLFAADRYAKEAAQKAKNENSWEQDSMNDLVDYLEQEKARRSTA